MVTKLFLRGLAVSRRCLMAVCSVALVLPVQAADTGVLRSGWQQYDTADWSAAGFNNHVPLVAAPTVSLAAVDTTGWGTYFFIIGGLAAAAVVANRGGGSSSDGGSSDGGSGDGGSSDGGSGDGSSSGSGGVPLPENPFALVARSCGDDENGLVYQRSGLQDAVKDGEPAGNNNRGFVTQELGVTINPVGTDPRYTRINGGISHFIQNTNGNFAGANIQPFGSFEARDGGVNFRFTVIRNGALTLLVTTPFDIALQRGDGQGESKRYVLFRQDNKAYLALPVLDDNIQRTCSAENGQTLTADQFALNSGTVPTGTTIFSLREGLRGYINGDIAVRLDNFFFHAEPEFKNLHLEHRLTPWSNGVMSLHADSGYKKWDDSRVAYGKLTAMRSLSSQMEIYMQAAAGSVQSDTYQNSAMRGLGVGAFYDNLLTHDDAYHVRLEQRFAAVEAAQWRLAVDATIGDETRYWRLGAHSDRDGGGAHVFYTREF